MVLCRGVGSGVKSVKMTKHFYGFRGARQKPPPHTQNFQAHIQPATTALATFPPSQFPTIPPSLNRSTLQIPNPADSGHKQPFRPPQTKPPSQSGQNRRKSGSLSQSGGCFGYWRVIRLLEGDFAPGGSLCPRRALLPNPTSSFNQPPNHSTLPTQKHPPRTVPPSKSPTQPSPPNREGDSVKGG